MIKVINEVEPYEVDGSEVNGLKSSKKLLAVESHWNRNEFVILDYDGKSITVLARDLISAINNSTNSNRGF